MQTVPAWQALEYSPEMVRKKADNLVAIPGWLSKNEVAQYVMNNSYFHKGKCK